MCATPGVRPPTAEPRQAPCGETSEKQAAKARQTDKMIARLDVVDEPRKDWKRCRWTLSRDRGPVRCRRGSRPARRRDARRVHPRPGGPPARLEGPGGGHRPERRREVDAAGAAARPPGAHVRARWTSGSGARSGRSTRPVARSRVTSPWSTRSPARYPTGPPTSCMLLAKFGGWAGTTSTPAASSCRETDPRGLALLQARGKLVLDGADNHLRPARDRATSSRRSNSLRGDDPAGHARPADAGDGSG